MLQRLTTLSLFLVLFLGVSFSISGVAEAANTSPDHCRDNSGQNIDGQ